MKAITIADQPWLSMKRTVRITIDGIKYRLFRASVTVAVITLAVAFLMNILAESLIKRNIASNTRERIQNARKIYDWSAKLSSPGSHESIVYEIAKAEPTSDIYKETQRFAGISDADMSAFQQLSQKAVFLIDFFEDLDYAKRRSMIHRAEGLGILEHLSKPEAMESFKVALSRIKSIHFEMPMEELEKLIAQYGVIKETTDKILASRAQAIAAATAKLNGRTLLQALSDADKDFGGVIRDSGFLFDQEKTAGEISLQAKKLLDTLRLEKSMEVRITHIFPIKEGAAKPEKKVEFPYRQLLAQQANVLPADVNVVMMWKHLESKRFATKYLAKMQEVEALAQKAQATDEEGATVVLEGISAEEAAVNGMTAERMVELARGRTENDALVRAERLTLDAGKGFMGLGERLAWLLFVSMLVCGIGITNAMMMAVTERFNEIATLKCLGALDGFIMIMFVLESCFMGLVGGLIGSVLGGIIGLSRMLVSFGSAFFSAIPLGDLMLGMVISILLGTLLAAISAVIPSYKAARLAPMEAMRVE